MSLARALAGIGPDTPLDVQGFDYSTGNYDNWHKQAPNIPSISSETSSAVSDRGEYANDAAAGHVSGYDNQYPGWGESAEQAWGGVGESNNQGILTRPFISGGWTWTGCVRGRAREVARGPLRVLTSSSIPQLGLPWRAYALRLARQEYGIPG